MSEYVIINKTVIENMIAELDTIFTEEGEYFNSRDSGVYATYKKILSQSTPLIPEIEKAYENGFGYYSELLWDIEKGYGDKKTVRGLNKQDYILNLKLDI